MARPTKQGIDYFPLDSSFDDDMSLFIADAGSSGLGILITIWQMIYSGKGYYIEYDNKLPLKVKLKCFSGVDNVVSVVEKAISAGIFSEEMAKKKILTSSGIQKRFFIAARKKKEVIVARKYLLISIDSYDNLIDAAGKRVLVARNATKEEGEEEEEEKEKEGTFKNVILSEDEKKKLKKRFNSSTEYKINSLSEYMKSKGIKYKSHYATILHWDRMGKKTTNPEELFCSTCLDFCKAGAPDHCHKSGGTKACSKHSGGTA